MTNDILSYYERELTFIREMGSEFARKYPKIAGRLQLNTDTCADPHVERLIEAFALLCGRVHKKIDDDFPEFAEALFQVVYPHYVSSIPSMAVIAFETNRQAVPPSGYRIDKGASLYSKPVNSIPCQFATGYPVTLWPIEVVSVTLTDPKKPVQNARQTLTVRLKAENGLIFSKNDCKSLRFFLNGLEQHVYPLYELIFNNVCHLEFSWINVSGVQESLALSAADILPVGFEPDDALIPFDSRTSSAYPLLFEYFCFPEKFLFFDLRGFERLADSDAGDTIEILFHFDRAAKSTLLITKETICLNAVPVINLFDKIAEPVIIDHQRTEYQVIPDLRRIETAEIYAINKVVSTSLGSNKETIYRPLYSLGHGQSDTDNSSQAYWRIRRQPSGRYGDEGIDLFISFNNLDFDPVDPGDEVVLIHLTCTNRDLPARISIGNPSGDFETELSAPVFAIRGLVKPTPTRRPPLGGALQWRLISHLSLNYLSIVEGGEEALKEILRLYNFDDTPTIRQRIDGIVTVKSGHVTKRIGASFCRGVGVTITFDEEKFVGAGLYLFAAVLERFIGQYVSINSFSQLTAMTLQRKEKLKQWAPRNGQRILL